MARGPADLPRPDRLGHGGLCHGGSRGVDPRAPGQAELRPPAAHLSPRDGLTARPFQYDRRRHGSAGAGGCSRGRGRGRSGRLPLIARPVEEQRGPPLRDQGAALRGGVQRPPRRPAGRSPLCRVARGDRVRDRPPRRDRRARPRDRRARAGERGPRFGRGAAEPRGRRPPRSRSAVRAGRDRAPGRRGACGGRRARAGARPARGRLPHRPQARSAAAGHRGHPRARGPGRVAGGSSGQRHTPTGPA